MLADSDRLRRRIACDRRQDTVALNDRAFVLHYRTDAAQGLAVAIGAAAQPLRRPLRDGEAQHARIVVLVVAPPRLAARYLQVVGGIARTLSRAEVVDEVLRQP